MNQPGTLYIVSTPIGNLEDISLRALRVLKEVDLILCEDTRKTLILLKHYQISQALRSYHAFNEHHILEALVADIVGGKNMALVSDSGTPGISDPGYLLACKALENNVPLVPVPGAAAFLALLAVSGVPPQPFQFLGFLPKKQGKRLKYLSELCGYAGALVFYESPHRIVECLQDVFSVFGNTQLVLGRELTKRFEEYYRGTLSEWLSTKHFIKGEYTVIIYK